LSQEKPKEFQQLIAFLLIIGVSWLLYWLLNWFLFKRWMMENLVFAILCIILPVVFYKIGGFFTFMLSLLAFTVFAVLGLFFSLYALVPLLSEALSEKVGFSATLTRIMPHLPGLLTGVLSTIGVFQLLTSEDLNSYLDTEAIFPLPRRKESKPRKTEAGKR